MKELYPKQSIAKLCSLFGKTRHSYYDRHWRHEEKKHHFNPTTVKELQVGCPD